MSNIIRAKNQNGDWIEIPALAGHDGIDGITPHIGENGNWFIGETDTGNKAGLEVATREILGGVRVGEGLNIDENGVLTGAPSSIVNYIKEHQYFIDGTTPSLSDGWYVFRGGLSFNGVDAGEDSGWITTDTLIYIRSTETRIYFTIIAPYRAHTNSNIAVYRYYDLNDRKWYPETATSAYTLTGLTTSTGLSKTNTTVYTPTSNYHPATKKYVDDAILSLSAPACMVYTDNDATILAVLQDCVTVDIDKYVFSIKKPALFQSMYGMAYLNTITATGKVVTYTFTGFVDDTVGQQDSKIQKVEVILTHNTETNALTKNTYLIETDCLQKNNTTAYTPTGDYNPTTKKYVDDNLAIQVITTDIAFVNGTKPLYANGWYNFTGTITINGTDVSSNGYWDETSLIQIKDDGDRVYFYFINPDNIEHKDYLSAYVYYDVEAGIWKPEENNTVYTKKVLTKENTNEYTPTSNYHPATKKYVDDAVANVFTVTSISQSDYDALTEYDLGTLYVIE